MLAAPLVAVAQSVAYLPDSVSPFGAVAIANDAARSVELPELTFVEAPGDADDYDKYYYFHRPDTDFATAYADISECDGFARGLMSHVAQVQPIPFSVANAAGAALGNVLAKSIFGSAEKRRTRRVNMRRCMNFKGYGRYGLSKARWQKFNFEEGHGAVDDDDRQRLLKQQALVASATKPAARELGL